ncbi:Nuclear control of ATP synthase 2 [Artemisia annua]|uniref:Nuclear control of ATP synthase 2 n=1 Tax=Artemisia annua TaxID=35608 RepID=A0A2U1PVF0_ARTAN|nr:Nuclear control of ATP synthase 2 [Artemisia annua]
MHIFLVDIAFSLQNEHGHYVNGLVLYTLDRLYKAVERHAKAYGEWSRVRDDLTSLGDPCLETSDKLHVISGLHKTYHCLQPLTRNELLQRSLLEQNTTWNTELGRRELIYRST